MARSTQEIKKTMTDAFLDNSTLREAYGISEGSSWNSVFSAVSLENILIFIVAACTRALEVIFDQYKEDVEERAAKSVVASVPWYYKMALAYQHGDALVMNPDTYAFGYESIDESKQLIKYCAIRDKGSNVSIIVNGDNKGVPSVLPDEVLIPFISYMNKIKVAGTYLSVHSYASDHLIINAEVQIDRTLINQQGVSIAEGNKPIEEAVEAYLKSIKYGGTFNKTKLVDAIQDVEGVLDVVLGTVEGRPDAATQYAVITGNNYTGKSGSYVADNLEETISYVV